MDVVELATTYLRSLNCKSNSDHGDEPEISCIHSVVESIGYKHQPIRLSGGKERFSCLSDRIYSVGRV
jgi:hypothetical protein